MNLTGLVETLQRLPPFRRLLEAGSDESLALLQAARPFVAAGLYRARPKPLVLLTARQEMADALEPFRRRAAGDAR